MDKQHILIIDDEEDIRFMLRLTSSMQAIESRQPNIVEARTSPGGIHRPRVIDLVMPEGPRTSRFNADEQSIVIVLKALTPILRRLCQAIERGAFDFVSKPFKAEEILFRIDEPSNRA